MPVPLYIRCDPDPVFATLHPAGPDSRAGAAVLFCPPFGWDEVCSYRPLRAWSERLAAGGHPALRLTLPGCGDSGGHPDDPELLDAWVRAVIAAAEWLRSRHPEREIVAVGIGLGGILACLAAAGGAPLHGLALWATPSRGRSLVRQLRAFSEIERSQLYDGVTPPAPPSMGEVEAGGFRLSAETVAALERIDLGGPGLAGIAASRALLLGRDGAACDERLRGRLEAIGLAVQTAPGQGFADMTSHPQSARPPAAAIASVAEWLSQPARSAMLAMPARARAAAAGPTPSGQGASATATTELGEPDGRVRETATAIAPDLVGVLAQPADRRASDLCVLLLNAGAMRRIGPNRLWVEAARRWAAAGVSSLRLDLRAIGDADGDETPYRDDGALYGASFVPQVLSAIEFLSARGIGSRFVVGGLCSGAFWSFHAALADPRVVSVMLLNPRALEWAPGLGPSRDLRALLTRWPSPARIRRGATRARRAALARWLAHAPARGLRRLTDRESTAARTAERLDRHLGAFLSGETRALLMFSDGEPLREELDRNGWLARLAQSASVTLETVPVRDHTLRPGWAQLAVHRAIDGALARELGRDPRAAARS